MKIFRLQFGTTLCAENHPSTVGRCQFLSPTQRKSTEEASFNLNRFDHWLSLKLTQRLSVKKCTYERVLLEFSCWSSCITAFWFTVDLRRCCQEADFQQIQQSLPEITWGRNVCVHRCRNCLLWVTELSSKFYRSPARKLALLSGQKPCCAQISNLLRSDKIWFSASWHLQQRSTAYGVLLLNWWTPAESLTISVCHWQLKLSALR